MENTSLKLTLPRKLKNSVLYGDTYFIIGIFGFVFGTFLTTFFLKDFPFEDLIYLNGRLKQTKATILGISDSGSSRCIGDDGPCYPIYKYTYTFDYDNESYLWHSFNENSTIKVGEKKTVEFNVSNPQYSVLLGFNNSTRGNSTLYVYILPLLPLIWAIRVLFKERRKLKILENGVVTKARFYKKEVITDKDDNETYKLIYYFTDNNKNRKS